VRITVSPTHPVARFQITTYDINMNYHDIGDFFVLLTQGPPELRNEVLSYNGIVSVNWEKPNGFTTLVSVLQFTFVTREIMFRYLKGEGPLGKAHLAPQINAKLKEFFDARDREEAKPTEPVIC